MTRKSKTKAKAKAAAPPSTAAIDALQAQARQSGLPMYLPTPERAGRGNLAVERITTVVYDRDKTGERSHGRRIALGLSVRDRDSSAKARLARFCLTPIQKAAALRFEEDWLLAAIEPRVTADLMGTGGGKTAGVQDTRIKAQDRVHSAITALRKGGERVLKAVEDIVIHGSNLTDAGERVYLDAARHNADLSACLETGLNLLAYHYGLLANDRPTTTHGKNAA